MYSNWLLYGANGYTGRLIAEEAVRRGMRPILAGRSAENIEPLAGELGFPSRIFALDAPGQVAGQLDGCRAVLHCAGPFSATAEPMMEACLARQVHYLDITGEIDVIESAAAKHERAVAAGVTLLPAAGFDVVPSDCLAAMLHQRLPDATRLELAFTGTGAVSPGTARTMLQRLPGGGRVRRDGQIVAVPTAYKTREIPFREGSRPAVTIPWGDVATAWHSTGIPNIEVYLAMSRLQIRALRSMAPVLPLMRRFRGRLMERAIRLFIVGPSAESRRTARGSFWGRVTNPAGETAEATLITPSGYTLTALTALASLEKILAGEAPAGFCTPSKAFGAEFVLSIPDTDMQWQDG